MNNKDILFTPYPLKKLTLKNRIIMAPMTRAKATDDLVPTQDMADYYARRADAGLIITEGTIFRPDGLGYNNVPGIFTLPQIRGWQAVTDAVHQQKGLIFMQLWHVGRVSHPAFLQGNLPVSPSDSIMTGRVNRAKELWYGKSRALTRSEITDIITEYAKAANNAMAAGFDGVEIHGANGYLIDQFLHYHTNQRTDDYGGNTENMGRFALEVMHACGNEIGYEKIGLRLSPGAYLNEMIGSKKDALVFEYLLSQLNTLPIAYVHTGNFNDAQRFEELENNTMSTFIRSHYKGTLIGCGSYSIDQARQALQNQEMDLVAIGRPFIANPNLITLISQEKILKDYDSSLLSTLY